MRPAPPRTRLRALLRTVAGAALATAASLPGVASGAQEGGPGRIVGRVRDAASARPIPSAQVYLEDGSVGTLTDLDGRFVLRSVTAGSHAVVVQTLGYGTKTVTDVEVRAGRTATLDVSLEERALEVEGITVSAARERGSTAYLLDERRTSSAMVEAVGAGEIARRPDSDAAEVAQRMTGVTVTDGKYVFVRGLGERYSQTSLNGSALPSPEPEREMVPLDLFPSGFLESLETRKSYTADLPADFSGGSVRIRTRDFPDELSVKLGMGTSFNTRTAFRDDFLGYPGGGRDFTGFDDGSRSIPRAVRDIIGGVDGPPLPADDGQLLAVARAFRDQGYDFAPGAGTAPLDRSFDASVGGRTDVLDDGELGWFVAGTYSDRYAIRGDEGERKYSTTPFQPGTPEHLRVPVVDYTYLRGIRNVGWGTLGNVTFKPTPTQKLSVRTTVNVSTEDEARRYTGDNSEDIGAVIRVDRLRFVERLMVWSQLAGEHRIPLDARLDWRLALGRADRSEPLLRESVYEEEEPGLFLLRDDQQNRYFWSELTDDDASAEMDLRLPFDLFGDEAAVKVGGAYRSRSRDFAARRLFWRTVGGQVTDLAAALDTATLVARAPRVGQFAIRDQSEPGDVYAAADRRLAGYAMLELPLGDRLDAVLGTRVETYRLELDTRIADDWLRQAERDDVEVAPSLNLAFSATAEVAVRGALSRTFDRPEFRELAPFQFTEAIGLRQVVGTPTLESAEVRSADLRVDWFTGPGELLSVGGFYKEIRNPIELVYTASGAYRYQNAEVADVYGVELDAQVALRRLAPALDDVFLSTNYSWIDSEVEVTRGVGGFEPTNLRRPLEGQAPYVVNAALSWAPPSGLEAGLFYNVFGPRLEAAGGSGVPDIFEQPRHVLDATLAFDLPRSVRVKVKATNLFDAPYRFEQSAHGITLLQREFRAGTTFSLGFDWEL